MKRTAQFESALAILNVRDATSEELAAENMTGPDFMVAFRKWLSNKGISIYAKRGNGIAMIYSLEGKFGFLLAGRTVRRAVDQVLSTPSTG